LKIEIFVYKILYLLYKEKLKTVILKF